MAKCPICHASVQEDFGLVECPGCGAQLLVHVDGRVEHQGASVTPEENTQIGGVDSAPFEFGAAGDDLDPYMGPPPLSSMDDEDLDKDADFSSEELAEIPPSEPEQMFDLEATSERVVGSADSSADEFEPDAGEDQPEPQFESQPEHVPHDPDQVFADADSDVPAEPATPQYVSANAPNSPDLSDIANFGNSDLSGGKDGALRYTVIIEGIDTADVRSAFREAMTDRKFMWDTDQILKSLRHGKVTITNVSSAKAYVLISRLRTLPVKVRWEQYAVHQT